MRIREVAFREGQDRVAEEDASAWCCCTWTWQVKALTCAMV